ncbi:MAG: bifunctional (p)ppGpp synthetase/guanosine-3',5'-bis(diphosphate) 3'-pyrophosphohydrolase [Actinomycetota bacterium]
MLKKVTGYNPKADTKLIKKAYDFASRVHRDQFRQSGEEYILHPLGVAETLADLELDSITIAAGLLHDVVEDSPVTLEELKKEFGEEIAALVDGVTKLGRIKYKSAEEAQAKNLRKMLVAMAQDIRIILIKLADRLHNMRTLCHLSPEKQKSKALETLEIYAPLAHRLGMSSIKSELEDLAFLNLRPKRYSEIEQLVAHRDVEREIYLRGVIKALSEDLKRAGIKADIAGRAKHYYSIYQKMVQENKEFDEIYDLSAVRVIVDTIKDCYGALGVIHSLFKPIPGRFKDFIAMPKFNMYQSLHTTVIGPEGRLLEIQIRTLSMHRTAEYGIAAHWRYKEGEKDRDEFEERLAWLRQMLEWQSDLKDPREFMEALKIDLLESEVFVFTPMGKVLSFPKGATPIDFAYAIHTDVGERCVGSRVNGRIVPLEYELQNGDIVEIITSKSSSGPSRDWLSIVKTSKARNRIKQWFAKEEKKGSLTVGREMLQRAVKKQGLPVHKSMNQELLQGVAKEYNLGSIEDLFVSIGSGRISAQQVTTRMIHKLVKKPEEIPVEKETFQIAPREEIHEKPTTTGVRVKGITDVLVRLAHCCNPVPPDEIVGFITRGRGVSVHRKDCHNARVLKKELDRFIDVAWDTHLPSAFLVEIRVQALDRTKLLRDITTVLGEYKINILSASVSIDKDHTATTRLSFEVGNVNLLNDVLVNIKKIDGVFDAYRVIPT